MKLKLWQVDAFAERPFAGNPAAVVPLESWLPDRVMQAIANENNLAETAFFVTRGRGAYDLRWFTPSMEVPMCGHATLASAWVIFSELAPALDEIRFAAQCGELVVGKGADGRHKMAMPASPVEPLAVGADVARALGDSMGVEAPVEILLAPKGAGGTPGVVGIWREKAVREMRISGALNDVLARLKVGGLLATAQGDGKPYDFVSRFFAPLMGVPEDPVTGSANSALAGFWSRRLNRKILRVYQASQRGGDLLCTDERTRVVLSGPCALYLKGEIEV